jgi:hypothetical protein
MSTSIKSNLYALLPDDAEDATETLAQKAPSKDKSKSSVSSSVVGKNTKTAVKIPQVDSLPVQEEDSTLAGGEVSCLSFLSFE